MFTWNPLYEEIARKVLEFENRQGELLTLLRMLHEQGLPVGSLEDEDAEGHRLPLAEIDPFTFFATFNWQGHKPEKRRQILGELRNAWHLSSPVPDDFEGIPLGNRQNLWLFAFQKQRDPGDIPRLWQLAKQVVQGNRTSIDRELFSQVLSQRTIGEVKLSIGMFWLNPSEFLAADKWTRGYMERQGVPEEVWNGDAYFDWLEACVTSAGTDFPAVSRAAYLEKRAPARYGAGERDDPETDDGEEDSESTDAPGVNYWLIQAGRGGDRWEEFHEASEIMVGFEGMEDFRHFADRDAMRGRIDELSPDETGQGTNRRNATLAAWQFSRVLKLGGIVFVYGGFHKMHAVARVVGDYRFVEDASSWRHRRAVEWLANGPWTVPDELRCPSKTLTRSTDMVRNQARLRLAGVNLQPEKPSRRYWWLNANPKIWDFRDLEIGAKQTYTAYNEKGNKRQKFPYFGQVAAGDLVLGYLTNPEKEIVALCEITKALHETEAGPAFEFKKTEEIARPISWGDLQATPGLADCEPIKSNQGSLFALTEEEFDIIRALIDERNPVTVPPKPKAYTRADALAELFMTGEELETILARLTRKKGLILQGPPGVGKTFVARWLAYALMGEVDEERTCMVQFHPSYGYEDFIQGYRPHGTGLRLHDGIFYDFARRARRDRRPWVFIIDEINRGNLAKIFGELLMLLEADKRGEQFALPLTYAGSADETFWLPENLHVIGTMNTADRSLAMVDYALRRRFAFATLDPALDRMEFRVWLANRGAPVSVVNRIAERLAEVNREIREERDLGSGFQIGHSYFCPGKAPGDWEAWYRDVVDAEITPLLEEYFDKRERVKTLSEQLMAL